MKKIFLIATLLFVPHLVSAETVVTNWLITETETWTLAGSPYTIPHGSPFGIVIAETGILNIEPGVEVELGSGRKIEVQGVLNILGEPGSEVRIKSAPIWNNGGEVNIKNSIISNSLTSHALEMNGGKATLDHVVFDKNLQSVFFASGDLEMTNSTISNTTLQAFLASTLGNPPGATAKFFARNNTFINNSANAEINPNVDFDIASTTFIGGDVPAWVLTGDVEGEKTLRAADGPFTLYGLGVAESGRLTIEEGTLLKMRKGNVMVNRGELNIEGTEAKPVIMTSSSGTPHAGDYGGIFTEGGISNIKYLNMRYAGGNSGNIIRSSIINVGGIVNLDHINFEDIESDAFWNESGTTTINHSTFGSGVVEVGRSRGGKVTMTNSRIVNGDYIGIVALGSAHIDAENNWWGSASGPLHYASNPSGTGAFIEGDIDFTPWLTQDPLAPKLDPVIIIPGIMGSAYKNGAWVIDPQFHVYDNLIETLQANGYTKDKDLFPLGYDWRKSNTESAIKLKEKIDDIKEKCNCNKVDIVAHSMGGLVTRAYAQSPEYEDDIGQLIFLGTPHRGSPKDYLTWEAGEIYGTDLGAAYLRNIMKREAKEKGYTGNNALFDYVHDWPIYSVKELLPVYNYLERASTKETLNYPNGYPENNFLSTLNQDLIAFTELDIDITNIIGNTGSTTISHIRVIDSPNKLPLWEHGYPEKFEDIFGDHGLEEGPGDGTVPIYSSKIGTPYDLEIDSGHINLPTDAEEEIYKELTGKTIGTTIKKSIPKRILSIKIFSPIDFLIVAPDGKKIGKNFSNNTEYNEIPGAFYSGFNTEDEYATIPDPIDGEYKIQLQGTGDGKYALETSFVSDTVATTTQISGTTTPNQINNVVVRFDNTAPTDISIDPDLIADINRAYSLGWIKDVKTRDQLLKQASKIIKFEKKLVTMKERDALGKWKQIKIDRLVKKIDKRLAEVMNMTIASLGNKKITEEGYNLLKADLDWLINH